MDKFIIEGGASLKGRIKIAGAKNGSLALMPATLLASGTYLLKNTPNLRDLWTMSRLMGELGAFCELNGNDLFIDTTKADKTIAPYEQVKKMRASFYVLGPLLARWGEAKVSLPGGCAWGPRPVDLHLKGMKRLGAEITVENGYVIAKAKNGRLKGANIHLDVSSVGASGNILMAATLADGITTITNAALEPEITALGRFLQDMGAKISGLGTSTIEIEGVDKLHPSDATTIPDRIEAATYLIAAAMTGGHIELQNVNPYHLLAVIDKLEESGCELDINSDTISLKMDKTPSPTNVTTAIYPGFPTDVQAQWMSFMTLANGSSHVVDNIYYDRFKHAPELARLGADVGVVDNTAIVTGGKSLGGATVMSSDLRASASLVLAGLAAKGETEVLRIYHLDRGYEAMEEKLTALGANIRRVKTELI
jgi:UDP-N-acetylglucosamine 1-carboxyvinyltransferase